MAIDDEQQALETLRRFEGLDRSVVTTALLVIGVKSIVPMLNGFLPAELRLPNVVVATTQGAITHLHQILQSRSERFFSDLSSRLSRKAARVAEGKIKFTEQHLNFLKSDLLPLILEGHRRALEARSEEKIHQIAAILANSVETLPRHPDTIDEMMRVAMELGFDETCVLREMYNRQRVILGDNSYRGGGFATFPTSPLMNMMYKFRVEGLSDIDVQSAQLKLQSYGLISRGPNSQDFADPRFLLLYKGYDFVEFALSSDSK